MISADNFDRDALKAAAAYFTRPVLVVVGFVVALTLTYCFAFSRGESSVKSAEAKAEVRRTETIRKTIAETVLVRVKVFETVKRRSDSLATLVTLGADSTIHFRVTPAAPVESIIVPPVIVERIRADSVTIRACTLAVLSCREQLAADSAVIRSLNQLVKELKPPRFGFRTGVVLGAAGAIALIRFAK